MVNSRSHPISHDPFTGMIYKRKRILGIGHLFWRVDYMSNQNGKGSKKRRRSVDQETWDKNYERIFKKTKTTKHGKIRKK